MKFKQSQNEYIIPATLTGLIKKLCANYKEGNCLLNDQKCYMFRMWNAKNLNSATPKIVRGMKICSYLKNCVLPLNQELYDNICNSKKRKDKDED